MKSIKYYISTVDETGSVDVIKLKGRPSYNYQYMGSYVRATYNNLDEEEINLIEQVLNKYIRDSKGKKLNYWVFKKDNIGIIRMIKLNGVNYKTCRNINEVIETLESYYCGRASMLRYTLGGRSERC